MHGCAPLILVLAGAVYLITKWYAQRQVQTRLALFYCASALSGAFSGLLAFAIARMDGVGGKPGWAWIFILEGIATVLIGVACFFIMPDTPALSGRWLNQEEQRYLEIQTVIKEGGRFAMENDDKFKWTYLRDLLLDYKVYMQAFILFTASMLAYGLKFTMPSITKSMGYTSANAQLMTIPPYVAGAISAIVLSKASDHYQWRAIFIFGQMAVALVGFCILLPLAPNIVNQIGPCYLAVMLICIGQYPTNPAGSAWISSNLAGDTKRAMGIALNICLGNTGGIAGSVSRMDPIAEAITLTMVLVHLPRQRKARLPNRLWHRSRLCGCDPLLRRCSRALVLANQQVERQARRGRCATAVQRGAACETW